jgi:hypothetical protein
VVYLALGVPVARIWHEATASHRYCAEHRVMEEAPAGRHSGPPAAPANGEQHESCPFTPLGGQTTLTPRPVALLGPGPCLESPARLPILDWVDRRTSVLSLAPKTSPPI